MFGEQVDKIGKHEALDVPAVVRNVIVIDQDPIGQNSHEATLPPTPNSSTKSATFSLPQKKPKPAATKKDDSASTLKAADAKPAKATASCESK